MGEHAEMLLAAEAAFVAGVDLRDMNRAADESILPAGFTLKDGKTRRFSPGACVFMAFYVDASRELTSEWRMHIIKEAAPRLQHTSWRHLRTLVCDDWRMHHEFLTVDLAPFLNRTAERHERLDAIWNFVTVSPEVLGGTPVIRGTRVPVYDVAASVNSGIDRERILAAYPSINGEQVDAAVLYVVSHPPRGRPRVPVALPAGTTVVESRVARRKKAG